MEKRAPCLACKMFTWLTSALMCKPLWTSDIKFPLGHAHFYSPSTGFTSRRSASVEDKINLQGLWILHQNSTQVSSNWILFGLNLQCKSTSFVQFQFRENEGAADKNDTWAATKGFSLFLDSFISLPFHPYKFKAHFSMQMELHNFIENSSFPLKFTSRHVFLIVRQDFHSYFTYFPLHLNRLLENYNFMNKFNRKSNWWFS